MLPYHAVSTCDGDSLGGNELEELNSSSDTLVPSAVPAMVGMAMR